MPNEVQQPVNVQPKKNKIALRQLLADFEQLYAVSCQTQKVFKTERQNSHT